MPGSTVTVSGSYFYTGGGCDEDAGCGGPERTRPQQDVPLRLEQGGRVWQLGTADASGIDFATEWTVTVPEGVRPGPATLVAGASTSVRIRVS